MTDLTKEMFDDFNKYMKIDYSAQLQKRIDQWGEIVDIKLEIIDNFVVAKKYYPANGWRIPLTAKRAQIPYLYELK
jgi:hypothetical protein